MNYKKLLFLFGLMLLVSCGTVQVVTDYDTDADFSTYKSFAFYKKGIDKVPISDLDKKRIMKAITSELQQKGMLISSSPDILVNVFTSSKERLNYNDTFYMNGFNGFYYPWYYSNVGYVSRYTEGTLFIDLLDAKTKSLLWQGVGRGVLANRTPEQKQQRINEFVKEIMGEYPPKIK